MTEYPEMRKKERETKKPRLLTDQFKSGNNKTPLAVR